jgi:hypothetical protein
MIAISTPLDSGNFYSSLIDMKDEMGKPVFEVLEASAVCKTCRDTLDDPSQCPHVQLERPAWKSKDKQKVVKALYAGNEQTMLRESMGVVTEGGNGVFLKRQVKTLFKQPRTELPTEVRHVYVAIDPNGGGSSKFAICSVIRQAGQAQVTACTPSCTCCRASA